MVSTKLFEAAAGSDRAAHAEKVAVQVEELDLGRGGSEMIGITVEFDPLRNHLSRG